MKKLAFILFAIASVLTYSCKNGTSNVNQASSTTKVEQKNSDNGDQFIGDWEKGDDVVFKTLTIKKDGDLFIIEEHGGFRKYKLTGILKDGFLELNNQKGSKISYAKSSGHIFYDVWELAKSTPVSSTGMPQDGGGNQDYQNGLMIIAKNDCISCHKIDEKNIGPSWHAVANKYIGQNNAASYLVTKIIAGGNGVWGNASCASHPALSNKDAEFMAQYILSLRN